MLLLSPFGVGLGCCLTWLREGDRKRAMETFMRNQKLKTKKQTSLFDKAFSNVSIFRWNVLAVTLISPLFVFSIPAQAITFVTSAGKSKISETNIRVPNPNQVIRTAAVYFLNAHPSDFKFQSGSKQIGSGFVPPPVVLGDNEIHGTTGGGSVYSLVLDRGAGVIELISGVTAEVSPGQAENLPVSFFTFLSDPLIVGPDSDSYFEGSFSLDVFLSPGTKFTGVPKIPSLAEDPRISLGARIAPGKILDPLAFFTQDIADSIDLYSIDIVQSNSSGLIEANVGLGTNNSLFSVSFSDPVSTIESRIVSAFSGNLGSYEVVNEQLLFSVQIQPVSQDLVYTFGNKQENLSPEVETIPEPSAILSLLTLGTLGAGATLKRQLKPCQSTEKETTKVG